MRVLVIDDSSIIRRLVRQLLVDIGFELVEAETAEAALEKLQGGGTFDLAVVDWNLPGMSGLDLVQQVRKTPRFDSLRILMLTMEAAPAQRSLALLAGANDFITKPFDRALLVAKVLALIPSRKGEKSLPGAAA